MEENKELKEQNVENEEKVNNKKNVFNIIIGIATLLIALLGATFAYFSATARSRDDDVYVKSAYVSISYDGGTEIKAINLIPATETVAIKKYQKVQDEHWLGEGMYAYADDDTLTFIDEDDYTNENLDRKCVDSKGKEVCYVYRFNIESDGEANDYTQILGGIKVNENQFTNLSYILYKVTYKEHEGRIIVDKFGNKIVDSYILVSQFNKTDTNPDNVDYTDTKFATFAKPFDKSGDNNEYVNTVFPVDCIFGYSDTYATAEADDITRCSTYGIMNQEKAYFELLVWLEETGNRQDEQNLEFKGTVLLEVPSGQANAEYPSGRITGQD